MNSKALSAIGKPKSTSWVIQILNKIDGVNWNNLKCLMYDVSIILENDQKSFED